MGLPRHYSRRLSFEFEHYNWNLRVMSARKFRCGGELLMKGLQLAAALLAMYAVLLVVNSVVFDDWVKGSKGSGVNHTFIWLI